MYIKHLSYKWSANNPPGAGYDVTTTAMAPTVTVDSRNINRFDLVSTGVETWLRSRVMVFLSLFHLNQLTLIYLINETNYKNNVTLEPSQEQKATLFQRVFQPAIPMCITD